MVFNEGAKGVGCTTAPETAVFVSTMQTEVFVCSTLSAAVDSDIAPDLNFGFGFRA
ncbi:hypothetical protein HanIR_Chr07g0334221 [Helianthus annuus]|nr:hypothetical protein HanIR_Chr07g0334221 [Helianthus annuus]